MTTHTRTYSPLPSSLPGRMVAFFRSNPDEELTLDDIVEKFDPTRGNIHTLLAAAMDAQLLVRDRDADGDYIYKAGPAVSPGVKADTAPVPSKGSPAPRKAKRAPIEIDLAAVTILNDIPIPGPALTARKKLDWTQLLDRMSPGQAAELPAACRATLSAAMARIHKELAPNEAPVGHVHIARKFTLRVDKAAGTLRVWRTE